MYEHTRILPNKFIGIDKAIERLRTNGRLYQENGRAWYIYFNLPYSILSVISLEEAEWDVRMSTFELRLSDELV